MRGKYSKKAAVVFLAAAIAAAPAYASVSEKTPQPQSVSVKEETSVSTCRVEIPYHSLKTKNDDKCIATRWHEEFIRKFQKTDKDKYIEWPCKYNMGLYNVGNQMSTAEWEQELDRRLDAIKSAALNASIQVLCEESKTAEYIQNVIEKIGKRIEFGYDFEKKEFLRPPSVKDLFSKEVTAEENRSHNKISAGLEFKVHGIRANPVGKLEYKYRGSNDTNVEYRYEMFENEHSLSISSVISKSRKIVGSLDYVYDSQGSHKAMVRVSFPF